MMRETDNNRVLYLSEPVEGKELGKTILLESELKFDKKIETLVDIVFFLNNLLGILSSDHIYSLT